MKKIYLVLFVILSIFVFSCKDNLISDDLSSSQNSGVGQVKVFVKQSRLIGPDISEVTWTVELRKDNENDTISGKNENGYYLFSGLSDGTYNITVSGKTGDVEKFTGSAVTTITNGNSVSVNVPIVAKKTDKENGDETERTGYATITMDMSDKLLSLLNSMVENPNFNANLSISRDVTDANITASLVKISTDEQGENVSIEFFDNQEVKFENYSSNTNLYEIPTGYYYLTFSGLDSFTIKLKDNLVEIGDGLTTNIVLTENDYELVEYYSSILYVNNEGGETADGKTLSNPIAFSTITEDNYEDLIYLLSDVDFVYDTATKKLYPNLGRFFGTISSFNSTVRTISANISDYSNSITLGYVTTLKNIKLSGSNAFSFESLNIDETVILDCEMDNDSTVQLSKKSNLQIGQNFSGDLYLSLNGEWNLGDTVVQFENGKPENSNFYIDSECGNSSGQNYSSMFYIDDSGKLAKYTDDFTSFAWSRTVPYLVTKTQAKNNTYTSIFCNSSNELNFTGISTYDEENQTWYFINNSEVSYALYSVTNPKNYEGVVEATSIGIGNSPVSLSSITAMDYDDGKLYMGSFFNDTVDFYCIDINNSINNFSSSFVNADVSNLTALLVDGDNVYMATKNSYSDNSGITHSAIWQLKLEQTGNGYDLNPAQTNTDGTRAPYYQTSSDIFEGEIDGSTFRITDLYIDGTEVYGLLANYIEKEGEGSVGDEDKNKSFMRGSVFKLEQNTSRQNDSDPIMNATQLGLRKSFPLTSDDLATAKQYFILPRKIVGILNKKLVIVDDGMVPDSNDCNVDRFALFDLAGEISETIDVGTSFTTEASVSSNKFFTFDPLFDAQ